MCVYVRVCVWGYMFKKIRVGRKDFFVFALFLSLLCSSV